MPRFDPTRSRRRTIRLSILGGIVIVLCGGLFTLHRFQSARQEVQAEEIIQQASEAFEQDAYARVIELLENPESASSTIAEIRDDADMLYTYVQARREVPLVQAEHLRRTIAPLQQVVRLNPENETARRELLDLLLLADRPDDALATAERLSQRFTDDAELMRYVGEARRRQGDNDMALEAFQRAGVLDPRHVPTQIAIARLLRLTEAETGPFIDRAESLYAEDPEDPRAEVIRALAYLITSDMVQARTLMMRAADKPAPDEAFIPLLVELLDSVDLYARSRQYLDENASPGITDYAGREALFRSFDSGDLSSVLRRVEGLNPIEVFPDILAVWAIASHEAGDNKQAQKLIDELRRRDDEIAKAWAVVLPLAFADEPDPAAMINTLTELTREREELDALATRYHPYLLQVLGETYLLVEEPEAAVHAMQSAAESRDAWFRPHRMLAQTLLSLGRASEAHEHAQKALLRHPTDAAKALRATTQLASVNPEDRSAVRRAVAQAESLLRQIPDEPKVLQGTVALLSASGQEAEARRHIEDVLRLDPPASADLLLALAQLSQRYNLGLDRAITTQLRSTYANTPAVIADHAEALLRAGNPGAGLKLIRDAMPDPATLDWKLVQARHNSLMGADDAAAQWISLADEYTDNLSVQLQALRAISASRTHPDFAQRVIDRLRSLGGESSVHWKTEQAKLLMDTQSTPTALEEALELLRASADAVPNRVDTQMELTRCLVLLNRIDEAEFSARAAMARAPERPGVRLLLGQVLHFQNKYSEARPQLVRVAQDTQANPALRLTACELLIDQGDPSTARSTLEAMRDAGTASPSAKLLLARLYAAGQQFQQADRMWADLLNNPTPEIIAFAAAYYEQTGRQDMADKTLAAVSAAGVSPADQLMLQAQTAARRGEMEQALTLIERAAELEPNEPARWRAAVQFALALSRPDYATTLAESGLVKAGQDEALQAIVRHKQAIATIDQDPALIPMAIAIVNQPSDRAAAIRAFEIINEQSDPAEAAEQLASLARQHPRFQSLHELTADRLLDAGQYRLAYDLASQAMARFANSVTAARVTTMSAYHLEDWGTLLSAASDWGARSANDRAIADLLLAVAQSALQRFEAAARTLDPYTDRLVGGVDANEGFYDVYTRALIRTERTDEAWALLNPSLASDATARRIAIQRIGDDLASSAVANRWIENMAPKLGPDLNERLMLLGMSFQAGLRLDDEAIKRNAYEQLGAVLDEPKAQVTAAYSLYGQIAQQLGDLEPAERSFRRVVEMDPNNPLILNNLAVVLSERGGDKLVEAESLVTRAISIVPDDANKLDTLARVQLLRGKLTQAEQTIDRAIAIEPNRAAWRLTRADILEAKGEDEQAELIRARYSASADR